MNMPAPRDIPPISLAIISPPPEGQVARRSPSILPAAGGMPSEVCRRGHGLFDNLENRHVHADEDMPPSRAVRLCLKSVPSFQNQRRYRSSGIPARDPFFTAYCLLPTAYCLLPSAHHPLFPPNFLMKMAAPSARFDRIAPRERGRVLWQLEPSIVGAAANGERAKRACARRPMNFDSR